MTEITERSINPELEVNPRSIAIIGTTLYPNWYPGPVKSIADTDKIRGDLALESLRKAKQIGYQVVIVDGLSSKSFKDELSGLNIVTIQRKLPGRAAGKRQVIQRAAALDGVKVIIRTEPEKVSLVEKCTQVIAAPIIKGEADIVIPKRNKTLFAESYPDYMHDSEVKGNDIYNRLLHKVGLLPKDQTLDILFGPTAFRNDLEIISLFMEAYQFQGSKEIGVRKYAQPEEFSDAQLFPIIKALFLGLRVASVEVPFRYPRKQKQNEDAEIQGVKEGFIKKRRSQRMGVIVELIHFIRQLSTDPKSKGKSKLVPISIEEL